MTSAHMHTHTHTARIVMAAACVIGAAFTAGCSEPQAKETKPARPVRTQAVTMAPPPAGVRYSATIDAFQEVPLAFKSTGYIEDVVRRPGADGRMRVAQAGDRVTKGTVLARVSEADYRERLQQGRARLAEGEAALAKARLDLERARTLFAADSLIKPDLDAAQASFDTAQARVTSAQADIELASSALRDTALIAPAAGVLLERKIEVGSLVNTGSVGFVLGDVSAVKARFGIPDAMIHAVKLGVPIDVSVDAIDDTAFPGRVTAVAPAADPQSRVFDVEVTIPNRDGQLRPGMIGTVSVDHRGNTPASGSSPALTVPLTAVVTSGQDAGTYSLMVVESQGDSQIARMRRVELGDVTGNGITVSKGVTVGERIVITGANLLTDGERVRVIP